MVKLGIDAKWYFNGPASGKVVIKNLVDEIIKIDTPLIEIYLFIDKNSLSLAKEIFPPKIKIIPVNARINLLSNLFLIPVQAKKYALDFVIFQNFSSFMRSKFQKITYIHDFLFLDYPEYYSKIELLYYKPMSLLAKLADHIITISKSEKDRMIAHEISNDRGISVIHHGINDKFKPLAGYRDVLNVKSKYNLPDKFLLYVGRINIRKNLSNLLLSLKYLDDKSIKLLIVGEEEHKNSNINFEIQSQNLTDRVLFTGYVPEEDLYLIYAYATIFCFPSFAEGFGLPPLESMKCGIPVIVSDRTSLPEVCGEAGTYVDPDSAQDIGEKINKLLENKDYYELKVKQSISHSKDYTWSNSANKVLSLIKELDDIRKDY